MILGLCLAVSGVLSTDSNVLVHSVPCGSLKKTHMHNKSSENIGEQMPVFMKILQKLILIQFQKLTYSQEDSHVKTSVLLERVLESRGVVVHSGNITKRRLGFYDPNSLSLKTYQSSLIEDSMLSLVILPRSGMMQNGIVYHLPPLVRLTKGIDYSSWPTPNCADVFTDKLKSSQQKEGSRHSVTLSQMVQMYPTPTVHDQSIRDLTLINLTETNRRKIKNGKGSRGLELSSKIQLMEGLGGALNPNWVEWLMGFPIGWTELDASEMQLFRKSQKSLRKQSKRG